MLRNFAFASAVAVLTMSCACYFTVKTAYRSCEKKRIEATYVSKNYEMPQTEDGTVMREISIIDQDAVSFDNLHTSNRQIDGIQPEKWKITPNPTDLIN